MPQTTPPAACTVCEQRHVPAGHGGDTLPIPATFPLAGRAACLGCLPALAEGAAEDELRYAAAERAQGLPLDTWRPLAVRLAVAAVTGDNETAWKLLVRSCPPVPDLLSGLYKGDTVSGMVDTVVRQEGLTLHDTVLGSAWIVTAAAGWIGMAQRFASPPPPETREQVLDRQPYLPVFGEYLTVAAGTHVVFSGHRLTGGLEYDQVPPRDAPWRWRVEHGARAAVTLGWPDLN